MKGKLKVGICARRVDLREMHAKRGALWGLC